jgi:hypothetical protein
VAKETASGSNAIAYELKHLLEYPQNKVGERRRTQGGGGGRGMAWRGSMLSRMKSISCCSTLHCGPHSSMLCSAAMHLGSSSH